MDTSKIVGEKIKALREDKSISIEELAQRSGLAIEQVERIENNIDIPSLAPLIKIARVLGVRLGTFLDDQDEVAFGYPRPAGIFPRSHAHTCYFLPPFSGRSSCSSAAAP